MLTYVACGEQGSEACQRTGAEVEVVVDVFRHTSAYVNSCQITGAVMEVVVDV